MNRIAFGVEWQEAPGVRDRVLARTWGRLTIRIDGHTITRALDLKANSERDGVYGPMFPLAEWFVENFWTVTSEIPRSRTLSARHKTRLPAHLHRWMLRHNMLSAGAGAALPNLALAADGADAVLAAWFSDPVPISERRTVRFVGEGRARLPVHELEIAVESFVNAVVLRLEETECEAFEEVKRLRADWDAVGSSIREEKALCRQLAKLGLDPYDVDDESIDLVERVLAPIPATLQEDLLDSGTLDELEAAACAALEGSDLIRRCDGPAFRAPFKPAPKPGAPPHEVGYGLARDFRNAIGWSHDQGMPDLEGLIQEQVGTFQVRALPSDSRTRVRGVVGLAPSGAGVLVAPHKPPPTKRFLLGRALGACLLEQCNAGPRALTDALAFGQAATRAFSAELLAPRGALAQHVPALISGNDVEEVARQFNVSALVVAHQLENHELATIVPD